MDPSAVNTNITVDDFDSVLTYADQSAWVTPDPSAATFAPLNWLMGTYHSTTTPGAALSFNFTGPAVYVYGDAGPTYGSFEVELDGTKTTLSAYAPDAVKDSEKPHLLFGKGDLAYAPHTLVLRNLGKTGDDKGGDAFLLDFLRTTVQLAPAGATITNTTLEETDKALVYKGTWGSNKSPNFSGGGSTFTHGDSASVSLSFHGSAIYVFGDKKNDHGLYRVELDSEPPVVLNGISGCGGAFGMTCEQQKPTLKFFASNLDGGLHNLSITNLAGKDEKTFFDLDSVVLSVPTSYAPRQLGSSAPGGSSPGSGSSGTSSAPPLATGGGGPPGGPPGGDTGGALATAANAPLMLLLLFGVAWLMRPHRASA